MKTALRILFIIMALLASFSCAKDNNVDKYRNIVYFVDSQEYHVSLYSDKEWDNLLDELLNYTVDGSTVTFYNADLCHAKAPTKGDVKFSTRDRNKMKEWCKKMEGEGMTVTITYDKETKEWNGIATKGRKGMI